MTKIEEDQIKCSIFILNVVIYLYIEMSEKDKSIVFLIVGVVAANLYSISEDWSDTVN